jgi:hypothetical protein
MNPQSFYVPTSIRVYDVDSTTQTLLDVEDHAFHIHRYQRTMHSRSALYLTILRPLM